MRGLNKAQVIGTIGSDLELKQTPNGKNVLSFSIATNEKFTDSSGVIQEITDWHNVVVWGKPAEIIAQYMSKGSNIYIEGKMRTRSWEAQDGTKRYKTEIVVSDFTFLPSAAGENKQENKKVIPQSPTKPPKKQKKSDDYDEISIEDIPF